MEYPIKIKILEFFFVIFFYTVKSPKLIKPGDDKSPKWPSIALITTFKVNVDTIDAKNYKIYIYFSISKIFWIKHTINQVNCWLKKLAPSSKANRTPPTGAPKAKNLIFFK